MHTKTFSLLVAGAPICGGELKFTNANIHFHKDSTQTLKYIHIYTPLVIPSDSIVFNGFFLILSSLETIRMKQVTGKQRHTDPLTHLAEG
jgi:hypothetical protein